MYPSLNISDTLPSDDFEESKQKPISQDETALKMKDHILCSSFSVCPSDVQRHIQSDTDIEHLPSSFKV